MIATVATGCNSKIDNQARAVLRSGLNQPARRRSVSPRLVMLDKEYEYYKSHEAELRLRYFGRCIVIKGSEIIGDYEDKPTAIADAIGKGHKPGTFLVQLVAPDESAQIAMFHSRVHVH